jgi:hypothetical protein
MATTFISIPSKNVGTTEVISFTATEKSILIGGNIVSLKTTSVPFSLILRRGTDNIYIYKSKRIETGEGLELSKGGKLVLEVGDKLVISAGADNGIDAIFSILKGVT